MATTSGAKRCMTEHVDKGSTDSHRYYLSRTTILEMLRDRGYNVPHSDLTRSLSDFRLEFGDQPDLKRLRFTASLLSNPNHKIMVVFMGKEDVSLQIMRGVIRDEVFGDGNLKGLILILQSKMNHFAKRELDKLSCQVEIFQITDLLVNITKHVLKPKLEILSAEEKQQLLNKYMVEGEQLPRMLETDAITRYYGWKKWQVVKITYTSGGIIGTFATYRSIM